MKVTVNGETRQIADGATVGEMVRELRGEDVRGIAVARNGEVVRRSDWDRASLSDDDRLEVLAAVQGG